MKQIENACGTSQSMDFEMEEFVRYATEYAAFGRQAGVEVIPFRSTEVPRFASLSLVARLQVLDALRTCVAICRSTIQSSASVADSRAIIWKALKVFGLRPPSDLFSVITSESVIEIHTSGGLQIFRTFNFYELCTYTLEDLFCNSWIELYGRDDKRVNQEIQDDLSKIYSGKAKNAFRASVRPHNVRELLSPERFSLHLQINYWAPLFMERTSTPVASMVIEEARAAHEFDRRCLELV